MTLPDYRTVPTNRSLVKPDDAESYRLWETYGNDHDGPQGEFMWPNIIDGRPVGRNVPLSQEQFEWFTRRNPNHNWCFIVMRKKVINPTYIWGRPKAKADGTTDFREELNNFTVLRYNPFFLKIGYLYTGWRSDKPFWPVPEDSKWHELGPGGGALDLAGAKALNWAEAPMPPTTSEGPT